MMIRFPGPGCLVEFMQGNRPHQAMVINEQSGQLRLYTLSRRETSLPASRLLPWPGPAPALPSDKQEMHAVLESAHARREMLVADIDPVYLWELSKDEITHASAYWFAELLWQNPDYDQVAACGHALLECKTHFKFQGQDFEVLSEEKVTVKLNEAHLLQVRSETLNAGRSLFPILWEAFRKNQIPIPENQLVRHMSGISAEQEASLEKLLRTRLIDPDNHETSLLWRDMAKQLPDVPYLPLNLLEAWGKIPAHYNFTLDLIGYQVTPDWFTGFIPEIKAMLNSSQDAVYDFLDLPFVSIDASETKDLDDAFHLEKDTHGNYILHIAIACPALVWPWKSEFDKVILRRASSVYLPEENLHMMPEQLCADGLSLTAGKNRLVVLSRFHIAPSGELLNFELDLKKIKIEANLIYEDCEIVLNSDFAQTVKPSREPNPALAHASMLQEAHSLALRMQAMRIAQGAVIIQRAEPKITLHECNEQGRSPLRVDIETLPAADNAQNMIGEFMVLLNASIAEKSREWNLPLIYRTQHVALPKDYAGIWTRPEEIARVVKSLPPASIDSAPRPHAGLGLPAYATISSPLRRYIDLFNQGQVLHYLREGSPLFSHNDLISMLPLISARSDSVSLIQKQRPRYWKLVYFKQNGDKKWYEAVIADENDLFVSISLTNEAVQLRAKRQMFGEKVMPGQQCKVRIGKVHPLQNEIQVVAVEEY